MSEQASEVGNALLSWYDRNHRVLPWRIAPADRARGIQPSAYHVWLSEIMLQQTTVRAVQPYFLKFVSRWPNVTALAAEKDDEIMRAWAGLGYYSRARNLKKCAERVAFELGGIFPADVEELKKLPGIGDYTAAAIAAIAFGRRAAVVDGNIERVVARLEQIETPLPAAKSAIKKRMYAFTPGERPGDFAQAMMDLGATICTPKRPACGLCPVSSACSAGGTGEAEKLPVKQAKKPRPVRRGAAFVAVAEDNSILLRKRPGSGLLGGMAEVPTSGWNAKCDGALGAAAAPFAGDWQMAGTITHVFTHFELRLDVYHADFALRPQVDEGWWSPQRELSEEALPTVMKKAIAAAMESTQRKSRPGQGTLI
ncbi:MAG: A/G-specific adenine glycosylase [Pseudomonadota bacterium]